MPAIARPDLLKIVEGANFRPEQVNDDVAEIDQNPIRIWQTFKLWRLSGLLFDFLRQMIGNRTHMTGRTTRSDDHNISK